MNNFSVNRVKLNKLLVIASIGMLFDGLTTILGTSLGIRESNPLVSSIGLGTALFIRVAAIALLYFLVARIKKASEEKWVTIWFYILIIITWGAVFLNLGAIIFVGFLI